jgi:hypothetical protein
MVRQWLTCAARGLWRPLTASLHKFRTWREKHKANEEIRRARGLTLLREWLSPEQKAMFEAASYFDVIGSDSGNRYRIYHGTAGNVHEIDHAGRPVMGLCFVPSQALVPGDVMLAQKIALETNEREALVVAKRFPVLSREF